MLISNRVALIFRRETFILSTFDTGQVLLITKINYFYLLVSTLLFMSLIDIAIHATNIVQNREYHDDLVDTNKSAV